MENRVEYSKNTDNLPLHDMLQSFQGKNVHIVGLAGIEGFVVLSLLLRVGGINITVHEGLSTQNAQRTLIRNLLFLPRKERIKVVFEVLKSPQVTFQYEDKYLQGIEKADLVFLGQNWFQYRSNDPLKPLKRSHPERFSSLMKLYIDHFPGTIIGVTGSNGKSTTIDVLNYVFSHVDGKFWYGGNERTKPQSILNYESWKSQDTLVLEISNRHLKEHYTKSPHIGVITNIKNNHLTEYESFAEYANCKLSLANNMKSDDYLIVPEGFEFDIKTPATILNYAEVETDVGVPKHVGYAFGIAKQVISLLGIKLSDFNRLMKGYTPLVGRCEMVGVVGGVRYIYDIKSTTIDSTILALLSFDGRIHLVVGGDDKGNDYTDFCKVLALKDVVLYFLEGSVSENLKKCCNVDKERCYHISQKDGIQKLYDILDAHTRDGDTVLVSPGGAGVYSGFFQNSRGFRKWVETKEV